MKGGADQHTKTAAALQGGGAAPETAARSGGGSRQSACPPHVLEAIYGKVPNKKEALENSLQRWWSGELVVGVHADVQVMEVCCYFSLLGRQAPAPINVSPPCRVR
jgi:hypothetical protein